MSNIKTLSEEHLTGVTGGRDDEWVTGETDVEEYQVKCPRGLTDPDKPGELRTCDGCEFRKAFVNQLGFTYYECVYQ